jgi:hypothetical protein
MMPHAPPIPPLAHCSYIAYEALCLFITTPLPLFGATLLTTLKRATFRVPKAQFMCAVVVLW